MGQLSDRGAAGGGFIPAQGTGSTQISRQLKALAAHVRGLTPLGPEPA